MSKDTRTPVTAENKANMIASGMSELDFERDFRVKGEKGGILNTFMRVLPNHPLSEFVRENSNSFPFEDEHGNTHIMRINGAKYEPKEFERVLKPEGREV